jgi:hypothetical protein
VNHFTPSALAHALDREGFTAVTVAVGTPELPDESFASGLLRRAVFRAARHLPGAVHTPLALNLQAYARRD